MLKVVLYIKLYKGYWFKLLDPIVFCKSNLIFIWFLIMHLTSAFNRSFSMVIFDSNWVKPAKHINLQLIVNLNPTDVLVVFFFFFLLLRLYYFGFHFHKQFCLYICVLISCSSAVCCWWKSSWITFLLVFEWKLRWT